MQSFVTRNTINTLDYEILVKHLGLPKQLCKVVNALFVTGNTINNLDYETLVNYLENTQTEHAR